MNKKGAVEFSMTTIIVVIIGVIILAIAIPWITGTLNKAGGLTDAAFDNALKQLQGDPTPDEPIALSQETFNVKRGDKVALVVRFLNNGGSGNSLSFVDGSNPPQIVPWFSHDTSAATGKVYDWRVVLNVPDNVDPTDYFIRAKVGSVSIPIVVTVE